MYVLAAKSVVKKKTGCSQERANIRFPSGTTGKGDATSFTTGVLQEKRYYPEKQRPEPPGGRESGVQVYLEMGRKKRLYTNKMPGGSSTKENDEKLYFLEKRFLLDVKGTEEPVFFDFTSSA